MTSPQASVLIPHSIGGRLDEAVKEDPRWLDSMFSDPIYYVCHQLLTLSPSRATHGYPLVVYRAR